MLSDILFGHTPGGKLTMFFIFVLALFPHQCSDGLSEDSRKTFLLDTGWKFMNEDGVDFQDPVTNDNH
jgi:hypothetical protein